MRYTTAALLLLCWSVPLPAAAADGYQPDINRVRAALAESRPVPVAPDATILPNASTELSGLARTSARLRQRPAAGGKRDSVWNGVLLGAAAGGAGGYLWASGQCDSNDSECFAIATPIGVLGGAAIGAVVGGIVDAVTYNRSR
jgi:hypothetical protein